MENSFNLKQFLAEGKLLNEIEVGILGRSLGNAFFMDNEEWIELDKDLFQKYILTHKSKLKSLWDSVGGNWEDNHITDDELKKAVEYFYKYYENHIKSNANAGWVDKMYKGFEENGSINFDEDMENELLNSFLNDLDHILN